MVQKCSICTHARAHEINRARIAGGTRSGIARDFAVSEDALYRHRIHIPRKLLKAREVKEILEAENLLDEALGLSREAEGILSTAKGNGELDLALKAVREIRGCLELRAKMKGELKEQETKVQVNLAIAHMSDREVFQRVEKILQRGQQE